MTLGDYIAIAFVVISTIITFAGFWLVATAVWGKRVERCRQLCEKGVFKNFLIGLVPFTVAALVFLHLAQIAGPAQALGLVLLGLLLFFSHVGVAGLAAQIGFKLSPTETDRWVRCRRGGGALAATFLIPVIGWILVFLIVSALGCGLILRALFTRNDPVVATGSDPVEKAAATTSGAGITA